MLAAAVLAQTPALELEWDAPPPCPQRDAVLASVSRRLGHLDEPHPGPSGRKTSCVGTVP
jgi:hypothetical protein